MQAKELGVLKTVAEVAVAAGTIILAFIGLVDKATATKPPAG